MSLIFFLTCLIPSGIQAETNVTIGTGEITGVFYQAGGAVARIVNKKRKEHEIRCSVESTEGSVFNINSVLSGDLDFGFTQSDRQHQAVHGGAEWAEKGAQTDLRSIFSLYSEACTLCVSVDSGVMAVADLKGKRVNIGNPGSGHRQNSIDALTAAGIDYTKDIVAISVKPLKASGMFRDGEIDAFFYTVGHPTGAILDATMGKTKVRLISMPTVANKLVSLYPYYVNARIPVGTYKRVINISDVETFGVRATLVTSFKTPDPVAYTIAKEIFEKFDYFKSLHVAFRNLKKENMLKNLAAPIHPGAMKYYKEAGLK
ncbi:MAG: TAXI family TRAP transporter solute-binding subunit [Desulfobacteraceae bacterium]|nr:TAXI family TRAP transporter solute-binding subunit [Desulfobacteraceae bacterium]